MDQSKTQSQTADQPNKARGRWKLLAVLAVCAAPLIASYVTYYVIKPTARNNYGTLIDPRAHPIPPMATRTLAGDPMTLGTFQGKWVMLKVGGSDCDQACQDQLFAMRQLRTMQGKEMERIERVWLITDDEPLETMLLRVNDGTRMLRAPADAVYKWLPVEQGQGAGPHLDDRPARPPDDALPEEPRPYQGEAGHRQAAEGVGDRITMHHTTLAQMAITALIVALLPLSIVWISKDANKYRKLVWIAVFITFDLIVFGAFTRLTDSGLGCPDWPGCYGLANPFLAHDEIRAAEALQPTGPVTMVKAWIEMIHRYFAMAIGILIMAMMAVAWYRWRRDRAAGAVPSIRPGYPTLLFFFVCLQGAFGAWTVTLKLQPVIVTTHLLLGMGLLALLTWFGGRQDHALAPFGSAGVPAAALLRIRLLAALSGLVLLVQLFLGGWVSTNYATLACTEFPLCGGGKVIPEMDFEHGFHLWRELGKTSAGHYLPFAALTAIHWVHRNFALVVIAVLGYTCWRAWAVPALRKPVKGIAAVLILQAATGVATIYLSFPLTIAVLHNAGAAALVLLLTMVNYRAKFLMPTP